MLIRILFAGAACAAIATSAFAQSLQGFDAATKAPPAFRVTPFYEAPAGYASARPGALLKSEEIKAPAGARAWRVMYASRTWDGLPVAVTGVVVAPAGRAKAPRPVLAWAHGTTGAARGCAPSLASDPARGFLERGGAENNPVDVGIPYLEDFIARGYVVTATDYQGQGGSGAHQYLVGETAARGVLDSVRAAKGLRATGAGKDVAVLGWSQGGQAALFAGETAGAYVPELNVRGVATLAPAATIWSPQIDQFFRAGTPHVYGVIAGHSAAYGLSTEMLSDRGRDLLAVAGEGCILELFKQIGLSKAPGVISDMTAVPGWREALQRNDAGQKPSAPVLVVHGTADNVVVPASTGAYRVRACAVRTPLEVDWIEGGDHRSIMGAGKTRILDWIAARLGGEPAVAPACRLGAYPASR